MKAIPRQIEQVHNMRDQGPQTTHYCDSSDRDSDGYDRTGYDRDDYNRAGYDRGGYDRDGLDANNQPKPAVCRQALCVETLMSLVAIDEHGRWSVILPQGSVLPTEAQAFLHQLVANS